MYEDCTSFFFLLLDGPTSPDLLRADVRLITIEQCQNSYPPNLYPKAIHGIFDNSMLCAGDFDEGMDTCSVSKLISVGGGYLINLRFNLYT